MNIYRSGTQVVISKLQAEQQAGGMLADMLWMADIDYFEDLAKKDLLLAYDPPTPARSRPSSSTTRLDTTRFG